MSAYLSTALWVFRKDDWGLHDGHFMWGGLNCRSVFFSTEMCRCNRDKVRKRDGEIMTCFRLIGYISPYLKELKCKFRLTVPDGLAHIAPPITGFIDTKIGSKRTLLGLYYQGSVSCCCASEDGDTMR